ncbi:cytochrome c [Pseudooceanicola sp. CBS1P-1]|uniref:C-type cytochrome n=1 Tax=Pseudooceanicola albus TaxID=2692189 RepID=A0A6L7G025_9RHOB|nr:cytochrome c [Pseudooceanicola endophyticus]MXN17704.1 c-type cytochrome [Pseudooceanicola albus]
MRNLLLLVVLLAVIGAAGAWVLTGPRKLESDATAGLSGDPVHGEEVFYAGGCAACHAAPGAEPGAAMLVLSGGRSFETAFGTFYAPNISPDPAAGIGAWSLQDLANAMKRGVTPQDTHLYPAFPYTTYTRASLQDIADLFAFLRTLPADTTPSQPQQVGFPFSLRRGIGAWKILYLNASWVEDAPTPELERGRYLVEALGHCAECHTPRDALGGLERDAWMAGAATADGKGRVPNLTPAALSWTQEEIAEYLGSGFTPEFDVAGGEMAEVVQNLSHLSEADRMAIAAYVKALPAVAD